MKALIAMISVLTAFNCFAWDLSVEGLSEEACPQRKVVDRESTIYCKSINAAQVKTAKVGAKVTTEEYNKLGFYTGAAVDLGIVVDADSNTVYFHTRWLLDSKNKKIGIITMEGWVNSEMQSSARFDIRYNLKGQIVMATEKELR